jgi:hypothetical protein
MEDRSGRLVKSESSYCEPNTISPGGSGSSRVMPLADPRYAGVKLDFTDRE